MIHLGYNGHGKGQRLVTKYIVQGPFKVRSRSVPCFNTYFFGYQTNIVHDHIKRFNGVLYWSSSCHRRAVTVLFSSNLFLFLNVHMYNLGNLLQYCDFANVFIYRNVSEGNDGLSAKQKYIIEILCCRNSYMQT